MKAWWKADDSSSSRSSVLSEKQSRTHNNNSRFGGGGRRRVFPHRTYPSSPELDERLKKNRKIIDRYLRRTESLVGTDRSLNADGLVFFTFQKFIVVIEVPADKAGVCFVYTMVCSVNPSEQHDVLRVAMELNYMQMGTRGATLGLDREEVNLCYSCPIAGLMHEDFKSALEDFLKTAVQVNKYLEAVKLRNNSF